ncbi:MAG TPA: hypothetical protein VGM01_13385, partial [Ktedonobacteraceae bacterium]
MRCLNCHKGSILQDQTICPQCGAYLPSLFAHTLKPGTLLKRGTYRIDYALDTGGFGTIYRAAHTTLDCLVAIKEFFPRAYGV